MDYQQIVFDTAISDGMPEQLARLIAAQAAHESNGFTSAIFLDCNNAFGYKVFGNAAACPGHPDYELYPTLQASTHEITSWIKRRLQEGNFPSLDTITTPDQYASLLKQNGYYEDSESNYSAGLIAWLNPYLKASIGTGAIVLAGLVLFLIVRKKRS